MFVAAGVVIATPVSEETSTTASGLVLSAPGTFPISSETVEFSAVTYQVRPEDDMADNWYTQYIEDKANVHINWTHIALGEQFKSQLNLLFATGDYPDLIMAGGNSQTLFTQVETVQMVSQGLIVPLDDFIETQSLWYKKRLSEVPGFREFLTTPDGHIYDFGGYNICYHCTLGQKMFINKTWLDNLGLDEPTTVDEYYNVLKAFKQKDANGNGDPNDEWPLSTCTAGAWVQIDGFLMCPFQFNDVTQTAIKRVYVDNGTIKAAYAQPGYRDGLRFLNKLWEEGLMNPDSFTQGRGTQSSLNSQNEYAIFGSIPAMASLI